MIYIYNKSISNLKSRLNNKKNRYEYYSLSFKYIDDSKVLHKVNNSSTQTSTSSLDLASSSLCIKGTSLSKSREITNYSPPKISFFKPMQ